MYREEEIRAWEVLLTSTLLRQWGKSVQDTEQRTGTSDVPVATLFILLQTAKQVHILSKIFAQHPACHAAPRAVSLVPLSISTILVILKWFPLGHQRESSEQSNDTLCSFDFATDPISRGSPVKSVVLQFRWDSHKRPQIVTASIFGFSIPRIYQHAFLF